MGLLKRVIPCLDVDKGRVVKGTNFVDIRDAGDPVELAARYQDEGADEIVFLDITASSERRETVAELARRVADDVFIPFTIGGGIRSPRDAQTVLDAGCDKVSVNSAAVERPELLTDMADVFGSQCVVLAVDARLRADGSGYEVVVHGGRTETGREAVEWVREGVERGAGEILLTSMDRDGTEDGYELELTRRVADAVRGAGDRLGRGRAAGAPVGRRDRGPRGRRPVRLDLPLRPVHGGRGQAGDGRSGHRRPPRSAATLCPWTRPTSVSASAPFPARICCCPRSRGSRPPTWSAARPATCSAASARWTWTWPSRATASWPRRRSPAAWAAPPPATSASARPRWPPSACAWTWPPPAPRPTTSPERCHACAGRR